MFNYNLSFVKFRFSLIEFGKRKALKLLSRGRICFYSKSILEDGGASLELASARGGGQSIETHACKNALKRSTSVRQSDHVTGTGSGEPECVRGYVYRVRVCVRARARISRAGSK